MKNFIKNCILFFTFSLLTFLLSCNLFNEPNDDYWGKIEEEIRWANAQGLEITIAMPPEWGSSPQTVRIFDQARTNEAPRMGYPFDAEFTPNSGYAFAGWLAFESDEYSLAEVLAMTDFKKAKKKSLNGKGIDITEWEKTQSGSYLSGVTVNVSVPIMLVPYCDTRLRIDYSNPPLTPTLNYYPYDQRIQLWFNMNVNLSTVWVDEVSKEIGKNIRIWARHPNRGDVTDNSDITDCFFISEYNSNERRLDISVKTDRDYSGDLQVRIIDVIVGPYIESIDGGHEMAGEQTITYNTDTSEMQKIYEAQNIQVFRNNVFYFQDFGTIWGNPDIDRRFKTDHTDSAKSTVQLRFSVTAPEGAPLVPNRFDVYEHVYADLGGYAYNPEHTFKTPYSDDDITLSGNVYTIDHKLQTEKPGLVRLIVIPWNNDPVHNFPAQDADEALAANRYVTVVMDNAPPGINDMRAVFLGGGYDSEEGVYTYNSNATLTLTLEGLGSLNDNETSDGILGIHYAGARNMPWTMDDRRDLSWRVKVGEDWKSGWNTVYKTHSTDLNNVFTEAVETFELDEEEKPYTVTVEFKDRLDNVYSDDAGNIRIISISDPVSVTELTATVNAAGDSISVSWTIPEDSKDMRGAYLYVDGVRRATLTEIGSTGTQSSSFSVIPINADYVRSGQPASGFTGYDISVVGYNDAGSADPVGITIWNIPGMKVNETNTAYINEQMSNKQIRKLFEDDEISNIVLTSNITLSNWQPIGDDENPFKGNFYGNGHTITINSFADDLPADIGLFGVVEDGVIRDLTLEYNAGPLTVTVAKDKGLHIIDRYYSDRQPYGIDVKEINFGIITGSAIGDSNILNCIVRNTVEIKGAVGGDDVLVRIGGIAGYFEGSGIIENCRSALSLTYRSLNHDEGPVYIGAIAGEAGKGSGGSFTIDNGFSGPKPLSGLLINRVTITADVSAYKGGSSRSLSVGGAVGRSRQNTMDNIEFTSGKISILAGDNYNNNINNFNYIGGLIGHSTNISILNSFFNGSIYGSDDLNYCSSRIGGIIGENVTNASGDYYIDNCTVRGDFVYDNSLISSIGGLMGESWLENGTMTITNSFFEEGNFYLTSISNTFNVGGVFGKLDGHHTLYNCGALGGTLDLNFNRFLNASSIYVGGFTGEFNGSLSYCFSRIDIITRSAFSTYVGGLLGSLQGDNSSIENCYATGSVHSTIIAGYGLTTGYGPVYIGGLVGLKGSSEASPTIKDSYALGNVIVDKQGGGSSDDVHVGGLVGNNYGGITNSFAAGRVSGKSTIRSIVGGLIGNRSIGSIMNNAVLGASVTAQAPTTPTNNAFARRISGNQIYNSDGPASNNRAIQSMRVEVGAYTDTFLNNTAPTDGGNYNNEHGRTFSDIVFFHHEFWSGYLGLGFSDEHWDFSRVGIEGFPRLRNVDGQ